MNINLRKVIRTQRLIFNIGVLFAFAIVFIQFTYTSYYVYQGVKFKRQASIQNYAGLSDQKLSNLKLLDISNLTRIERPYDMNRKFAFFSETPACTMLGINVLLKETKAPIHRCDSFLTDTGDWLNVVHYSGYRLDVALSIVFAIIIAVMLILILIAVIQIKWTMPFFELQRFAQDIGMRMQASPLRIPKGLFTQQTAETFDFMQKRIEHVLTYQNKLLAMTCHDIRTPLARMQARRLKSNGKLDRLDLRDIEEINQMLDDLVLFSKENWLSGIQYEPTSISDFFEECVQAYLEDNKNVRFINMLEEDIEIDLKRAAFKRAINNLINNALKYGNQVEVLLTNNKSTGANLQINIKDNGPGIPQSEIGNVFKPFYSGSSLIKGNGLGLSITKEILDIHGGNIHLRNRRSGGLDVCILL